ncbi:MAG: DUF2442 domain-containing protein [Rhodoferax sp.]
MSISKQYSARVRFDEVVTQDVLDQAIKLGRKRAGAGVHATSVQYVALLQSLLIGFADQSAVSLPIKNYPELAALTDDELKGLELGFGESALVSEARGLHLSIAGLISASEPLMVMAATLIAARFWRQKQRRQSAGGPEEWQEFSPAKLGASRPGVRATR